MPVTEQADTLPHHSGGISETSYKEKKEKGGFSEKWMGKSC